MHGIRVIRVISGELSGILLIRSNFPGFSVDGQRSESQLHVLILVRSTRNSRCMGANRANFT